MRLRSSVGVAFALAFLLYGSEAWAAACNGGNCPAATFVVTGIVSPQAAGTVSSTTSKPPYPDWVKTALCVAQCSPYKNDPVLYKQCFDNCMAGSGPN